MDHQWRTWLLIGATGFGGPAGQMAILHREVVERKRWLDEEEFLAAMRLCMLLPGPEAQQLATYAGWRLGGLAGGLLAGTRPAVVALVALAAWRIGRKSIKSAAAAVIAVAALAALTAGVPFPLVVAVAGIVGWFVPLDLAASAHGRPSAAAQAAESVAPSGAKVSRAAAIRWPLAIAAAALLVWIACYGIVWRLDLAGNAGPAIARLFTETTLLSLGGAYAVVPWALEESVARGWLEPAERFDALAMGEATPGPLILVVTFIGFLAGWKADPSAAAAAGLEGAAIATLFAFIPSFGMVLALAPLVRTIRAGSWLGRAMTAIGAAVVAAIVLLGLRLAAVAFFPQGSFEVVPLVVAAASGSLLATGRASTPIVVLAAAVLGAATA